MLNRRSVRIVALVLVAIVAAGCAAQKAYNRAEKEGRRENWDKAVLEYSRALSLDPGNARYGVALERAKLKSSADHFERGKRYASASQWELAVAELQQALLLHPGNEHARVELQRAMRQLRAQQAGPSDLERLKRQAALDAIGPPKLDPRSNIPILLNFKEVPIGKIFEAISKASQINFIFDEKVDLDKPHTIDIGNVSLEKAMDILMLQTKNFYKVIDEYTLLIAPDTKPKRTEYEDNVIQTFYLSNGDTKQVVTLLRSLLQSRQIAENPDLNSVSIKDTPDKVAISERIIQANDKSKGEVLIDVELLEINRNVTRNLGIDLSSYSLGLTFQDGESSVPLNNLDALKQAANWFLGPIPSVILNFLKSDSETKAIAKPQLRVTEGQKAEILIGDRIPIPTTSFNTSQTVGGNIVPVTSFTYQNVGVTLQIEPRVHHNKEVTLKVTVEFSQVTGAVEASGGYAQPIIGTRQIQTVIRLRDGETNILAGLIKREDKDTITGIPGLVDLPGINKILAGNETERRETDIILTLTPQIVRMPDITEEDLATLWVGTEENMRLRGPRTGVFGVRALGGEDTAVEAAVLPPDGSAAPRGGTISRTSSSVASGGTAAPAPTAPASEPTPRSRPGGATPVPVPVGDTGGGAVDDGGGDVDQEEPEEPEPDGGTDAVPSGPVTVRLVPSQPSYRVGDVVTVQVIAEGAVNVGSVPYHLRYNRQVLEFLSPATEGDLLRRDGSNTVFLANDTGGGGEIVVGHSRMGGTTGIEGSGVLATFQFQAVNAGDCGFAFTAASVKDPQARNRPASFLTAAVAVTE